MNSLASGAVVSYLSGRPVPGFPVSVSKDGNIAVVGMPYYGGGTGRVFVHRYVDKHWTEIATLSTDDPDVGFYGKGVGLSDNGTTLAVLSASQLPSGRHLATALECFKLGPGGRLTPIYTALLFSSTPWEYSRVSVSDDSMVCILMDKFGAMRAVKRVVNSVGYAYDLDPPEHTALAVTAPVKKEPRYWGGTLSSIEFVSTGFVLGLGFWAMEWLLVKLSP